MMSDGAAISQKSLVALVVVLFMVIVVLVWQNQTSFDEECNSSISKPKIPTPTSSTPLDLSGGVSGTTGKLFKGQKILDFAGPRLFNALTPEQLKKMANSTSYSSEWIFPNRERCKYWSVVTTIFPPTVAIERQSHLNDWCMVIVGDRKGPKSYVIENKSNYVYLTVEMQEKMQLTSAMAKLLPWNHFGRKNVGFLYAIVNGAKAIYDFDDDNALVGKHRLFLPGDTHNITSGVVTHSSVLTVRRVRNDYNYSIFNPYPNFGANNNAVSWPRGYPLDLIKATYPDRDHPQLDTVTVASSSIGIVQFLANGDPDFDAIYRLTSPMPVDFATHGYLPLLLPHRPPSANHQHPIVYSPFNAQTTLFMPKTFWSMLLPVTVHGRVSDIWRSYATQRLLYYVQQQLIFSSPLVLHMRNDHNYMADFNSEIPLYTEVDALIDILEEYNCNLPTLAGCMEDLQVMLYEHGILKLNDVLLQQAWITDLIAAGYDFPTLQSTFKANR